MSGPETGKLPERLVGSEADRLREVREAAKARLAEDLLRILTQEVVGYDEGSTIEEGRLVEQMQVAAEAAMAAAEVIYPKPQEGAETP